MGLKVADLFVAFGVKFDSKKAKELSTFISTSISRTKVLASAAVAASSSLGVLAKGTSFYVRKLDQSSKALGINSQALQELAFAAKDAGNISEDELIGSLEGVSQALDRVRIGEINAASAFQRLGLAQEVISNKSLDAAQVLGMVADRVKDIQDPIKKSAIVTEIFGGSAKKLIPFLDKGSAGIAKLGAEGRALGAVLDTEAIKQAVIFDKQWNRIAITISRITKDVGTMVQKAMLPLLKTFQKYIAANRVLIAQKLGKLFNTIGKAAFFIVSNFVRVGNAAAFLYEHLQGIRPIVMFLVTAFGLWAASLYAVPLAIAAVILILEDLVTWFQGGDSVIGEFFDSFINAPWENVFKPIFDRLMESFMAAIRNTIGAATALISAPAGLIGSAIGGVGDFLFGGPSDKPATSPGASTSNTVQQKNEIIINTTLPNNVTPEQGRNMISGGVEDGMAALLRQTVDAVAGGPRA